MTRNRQETYDGYQGANPLAPPHVRTQAPPAPDSTSQHFGWWSASLAFSTVWMLQTWQTGPRNLTASVWPLLLSLGICYGIHKFSKPQSRRLANLLCIVSALVLLLQHAAGT